jgi:hypothetical protein
MTMEELFGEVISSYSRAQAIADGVLVDLSEWAGAGPGGMMGGFKIPVAITQALWTTIESIPESQKGHQDVRGRAHDVLWMASCAARSGGKRSRVPFEVLMHVREGKRKLRLFIDVGPGDRAEPVVTIGYPEDF